MSAQQVRIGDFLELQRRKVLPKPSEEYVEIGLRSFGKGAFHKEPIAGVELGNKKVYEIAPGDLVISNVFAWEGALAVATDAEKGLIGSHRFMTWTPRRNNEVDVGYLWHYLVSDSGLVHLRRASPGSAGRNRTLGIAAFENTVIPLPAFPEQERIAARLDRVAARTSAMSRFVGSGLAAIRSIPPLLEQAWERANLPTVSVGDLCQPVNDLVRPGADPAPAKEFVGLEFLQGHTGVRVGSGPVTGLNGRKLRFRPGDVLYGYLRPYQNKVWAADRAGLCSVEQYVLRPNPGVSVRSLSLALRSSMVLDYAVRKTNSLQLPRLGLGALLDAPVPDLRLGSHELEQSLQRTVDTCLRAAALMDQRDLLTASVLPAARNDEFAKLT